MKQKIKKKIQQCIAIILVLTQSIILPINAATGSDYVGDSKQNPDPPHHDEIAKEDNPAYTYYSYVEDQGLRLYVTDANGNIIPTDNGYDVIDFLYVTALNPHSYNAKHLRAAASDAGNYNTDVRPIEYLGFESGIASAPNSVKDTEAMADSMRDIYFNDNVKNHLFVDEAIYINGKQYTYFIYDPETGEPISRGLYAIKDRWSSLYNRCKIEVESGKEIEYYLHIEHIYAIIYQHWATPTNVSWYGTVYEAGRQAQETGNCNFLGGFRGQFLSRGAKYMSIHSRMYDCFQGFPALQLAVNDNNNTLLSADEICSQAYGINIMSFVELGVGGPIETKPTDPLINEIPVEKEEEKVIEKVERVDEVEIYTGYGAQNGFYDIGTNGGIPTTEYIRNVIEAQDFIIDYGYNAEKFVPTKEPTVTYTLDYYVPCTCPEESHEEDDYGYDSEGDWVVTGSHTVIDKPFGYHGNLYHTASSGYNGATPLKVEVEIPRDSVYYKITDYMIYGLESVSVLNKAGSAFYSGLSPIEDVKCVISGKNSPTDIENVSLDKHVDYRDVKNLAFDNAGIGQGIFSSGAEAQHWVNSNGFTFGNERVEYPKVANDKLIITIKDRGDFVLMDNQWVSKEHADSTYTVVADTPEQEPKYGMVRAEREEIQIPYDLMNGNYSSEIYAYYCKYAGTSDHCQYKVFSDSVAPNHHLNESVLLKNGSSVSYASQEPIHIMTPIISPFHTTDSNKLPDLTEDQRAGMTESEIKEYEREQLLSGTQLVEEADCQQLRLDETYTLSFDPYMLDLS